jgi:hypothetical protein
MFIKNLS